VQAPRRRDVQAIGQEGNENLGPMRAAISQHGRILARHQFIGISSATLRPNLGEVGLIFGELIVAAGGKSR
jgi:hypothetical protein